MARSTNTETIARAGNGTAFHEKTLHSAAVSMPASFPPPPLEVGTLSRAFVTVIHPAWFSLLRAMMGVHPAQPLSGTRAAVGCAVSYRKTARPASLFLWQVSFGRRDGRALSRR